MAERIIKIEELEHLTMLFGNLDENIRLIEKEFSVDITFRSGEIKIIAAVEGQSSKTAQCTVKIS